MITVTNANEMLIFV